MGTHDSPLAPSSYVADMEFLVETYLPRDHPSKLDEAVRQARAAAETLTGEGTSIRYLRSILLPDEETCFHLYRAQSLRAVEEASRRAGLSSLRIAAAVVPRVRKERSGESKAGSRRELHPEGTGLG